ncbi:MAG: HigA family addiction module antitoxin [Planctomycetota bacterium]
MSMYNPAHPGEILKELVLDPIGLSISETAFRLGVNRNTLSRIINCHGTITPEIALRLEMTFGKPDATHWLRLQNAYDLWQLKKRGNNFDVNPIRLQPATS